MPSAKRRTHADTFKDVEDSLPQDFDPEDEYSEPDDNGSLGSEDESEDGGDGREHYQAVGKSRLRQNDLTSLGPQYAGARVSRSKSLVEEPEHDPFAVGEGRDSGSEEDVRPITNGDVPSDSDSDMEDMANGDSDISQEQEASDTSDSALDSESDEEGSGKQLPTSSSNRAELRRLMNDSEKSVAQSIALANKADADKGTAVKQQRSTFDSLLNTRIRLQHSLVATNSFPAPSPQPSNTDDAPTTDATNPLAAAEAAAITLWTTLSTLRDALTTARTGQKRKRTPTPTATTPSSTLWADMQAHEATALPYRHAVLQKWATRAHATAAAPTPRRHLQTAAGPTPISDMLQAHLLQPERLVARTRTPRSCAPLQANAGGAPSEGIFDDADFYGVLLKELLEQRGGEVGAGQAAQQQWRDVRGTKVRKAVDTKASKGRKMRFQVHEKLLNFMAPEDRGAWGERRVRELFGSLLGQRVGLGEEAGGEEEGAVAEAESALRLFRN